MEFVAKVKTFFNDIINKHATYQQLLKKHKQLLDLKPSLLKKLLSAKSRQFHIVSETSIANAQIHKRSLEIDELRKQLEDLENQIDDLKAVVNKCDVQKEELNAECSEWAQQSKEFSSTQQKSESKEKLISLLHGLNQHQGLLPSDVKEYVQKVQNFFNDNIINHAISQEVLKKHNQLLNSKTDLMNKLLSAKSTQTHVDNETSTVNAQIHEISLEIDELRKKLADLEHQRNDLISVMNQCDDQKKKLKAECSN
ncbi:hypothetical protein MTR_0043s0040 [Medicago truncatula]|uniref:Uncharacterized protein n=1 Tax=Medicago truncatula TaxID=3880 RepID=A0A072TJN7_MEDTR|nr:hypothetical protein MTR_0043s0040 [Medicago truncatula]